MPAGAGLFGSVPYTARTFRPFGRRIFPSPYSTSLVKYGAPQAAPAVSIPHFRTRMVVRSRRRYGRRRSFRPRGRQVGRMRGPVGNWRNARALTSSPELKFKDISGSLTNILGTSVGWQVLSTSVNLVDQGYGQQDSQGRKIIAKSLQLKMQLDRSYYLVFTNPQYIGGRLHVKVVLDRQACGAAIKASGTEADGDGVLVAATSGEDALYFNQLPTKDRYRVLKSFTLSIPTSQPVLSVAGTAANVMAYQTPVHTTYIKLGALPIEFSGTSPRNLTDVRSNNIGIIAFMEVPGTTLQWNVKWQTRLRFVG